MNLKKIVPEITDNSLKNIQKTLDVFEKSFLNKQTFLEYLERETLLNLEKFDGDKKIDSIKYHLAFDSKFFKRDLLDCGSWLEFMFYKKQDILKLDTANFCKRDKLCVPCAIRRAYKQQLKFLSALDADKTLLDQDWYYIVIPIKHDNSQSYETVFNNLESVRKKILKSMRNKKNGVGNNFWSDFNGGMFSIESTKTKNGWNIHLNLIVNAPKGTKIDLKAIRNKKGQYSHQSPDLTQFLLKTANSKMHNIDKLNFTNQSTIRKALVEVLKYSLKFGSLSKHDLLIAFVSSYRRRLFGTFGNLRGLKLDDVELEGDVQVDDDWTRLIIIRSNLGYRLHEIARPYKV